MRSGTLRTALGLGLAHAVVDAASVAAVYAEWPRARLSFDAFCGLVIVYNGIAFGLQAPCGLLCDRFRRYRSVAIAGLAVTALGVAVSPWQAWWPAILAGLGNALFHVGAGGLVLRLAPGRAAEPGLFLAPGAVGLSAGVWLGKAAFPGRWWLALALVGVGLAWACCRPASQGEEEPLEDRSSRLGAACGLLLLLLAVAARSLAGEVASSAWRDSVLLAGALTAVAVVGKAAGGLAADRLGWRTWGVAALVLAAPWAWGAGASGVAAVLSMLFVQLTAAVTLAGIGTALRSRPATAFGLASGALLAGAVPGFAGLWSSYDPLPLLVPLVLVSAVLIGVALGRIPRPVRTHSPA